MMIKYLLLIPILAVLLSSCATLGKPNDAPYCQYFREPMPDDGMAVSHTPYYEGSTRTASSDAAANGAGDRGMFHLFNSSWSRKNGVGVIHADNLYRYPRQVNFYKYYNKVGVDAIVVMSNADSVFMYLRNFPAPKDLLPVIVEEPSFEEYPFSTVLPTKRVGKNSWLFKGEQMVSYNYEAVPKGKDLYLKYYIKFHPDNRYRRKLKYSLKTHKQ